MTIVGTEPDSGTNVAMLAPMIATTADAKGRHVVLLGGLLAMPECRAAERLLKGGFA
jgi:hypothetical protein